MPVMAVSVSILAGRNYTGASESALRNSGILRPRRDSIPGQKELGKKVEAIWRKRSRRGPGVRSQHRSAPENVAVVNGQSSKKAAAGSAPSVPFGVTAEELARLIARRQRVIRVAYQGVPGAYSEVAAMMAHPGCVGVPCKSYEDAVFAVECRKADRAVLPVESTLEGSMVRNYDLLLHHSLHIVKEIQLFVHYCLLVMPGVSKENVRRVISHPMALAHCGHTLARLGLRGDLTREPVDDTAGAAEFLLSNDLRDTAAIASPRAAEIYGLRVVARGIQDESWNVTRFLILARNPDDHDYGGNEFGLPPRRPLKTSIVVAHDGGGLEVLLNILSAFSRRKINLTKLETNPRSAAPLRILDIGACGVKQFEHVFYIDFEASLEDPIAQDVLRELRGFTTFIRVLGCYGADPKIYSLD